MARIHRRAFKQEKTFAERLIEEAKQLQQAADSLPTGNAARELLLQRIRQTETALRLDESLNRMTSRPS
jgi:hypothetical protein